MVDATCNYAMDPDLILFRFLSYGISDNNWARYKDPVLDDLYTKQSRSTDPEERKKLIREFEKRLVDEEVHNFYVLQWHRIIPHNSKLKGWTITPSHYLNNQLDTVWLSE
jgi:peptide/nickel transport system substrate-binding protein